MWTRRRRLGNGLCVIVAGLLLVAAAAPCRAGGTVEQVREHLAGRLAQAEAAAPPGPGDGAPAAPLAAFYAGRGQAPLWIGEDGARPRARRLLAHLRQADGEGLRPSAYDVASLAALIDADGPAALAELELRLSRALLRYADDLRHGRLAPARTMPGLAAGPPRLDAAAVLAGAGDSADPAEFLARLSPANPSYRRLRRALAHYRAIAADGGWPAVPPGPTLKEGMRDAAVAVLRRHLEATGDLSPAGGEPALFDAALAQAVRRYQARHGLEADGAVGAKTRAELAVPVGERIRQIEINMERWRWMPDDLGARYILVNLAGFEVELVEHGAATLHMRAVVGQPYRKTPVFSDRMTYVELNPTWTVPPTIMKKDLIPRIRAEPDYLAAHDMRVYAGWSAEAPRVDPAAVDWQALDAGRVPYRFVQAPGPRNPLGRVKFMFPNRFHIYLHDTPQPELFQRARRSFSSGCIRVEKPMQLLEHLLADKPGWDRARIEKVLDGGTTTRVSLPQALPIHITYATAWIGEGGTIHFRDDIYGRDALLDQALSAVEETRAAGKFPSPSR